MDARACLQTVDVLSDEALVGARSRLNPAAGVMLSALWAGSTGQLALIIHHLAVDGVSWRIVLEDLNIAWAQHRSGQPVALPATGTSFARWSSLLEDMRAARTWWPRRRRGDRSRRPRPRCRRCSLRWIPMRPRGTVGVAGRGYDPPAARGGARGVSRWGEDILLIAFGLAFAEFVGTGARRSGSMSRATGGRRSWARDVDLSRTVGWFTTKYPVALGWVGCPGGRWWPVRPRWGR